MQEGIVKEWLALHPGIKSVVEFREKASGRKDDRAEFKRMMHEASVKSFDTLVVYKLDRLSRSAITAIRTILTLDELGIGFVSVTQSALNLAHTTPFRRTILMAFSEMAQLEAEMTRARIRDGVRIAQENGVKFGRRIKVTETKRIEINLLRNKGHSIKRIAELTGLSVGSVHRSLTT